MVDVCNYWYYGVFGMLIVEFRGLIYFDLMDRYEV